MGLVLSVRKGDDFFVGEDQIVVTNVRKNDRVVDLRVTRTGKAFTVTDEESVEVLPNVMLCAGQPSAIGFGRVIIDAPRSLTILRGTVKRGEPKHGEAELVEDRREKRHWT